MAMYQCAGPIHYHTLAADLEHQGTYELAGRLAYLSELCLATVSAAHIEHDAPIVLEQSMRRRYVCAGQLVAEQAWNRRTDLDTVKRRAKVLVLGAYWRLPLGA
jgi:replicative DNA helicase